MDESSTALQESVDEFGALQTVITALRVLDSEAQMRILEATATFLNLVRPTPRSAYLQSKEPAPTQAENELRDFSTDRTMSPKEFLLEKNPMTDVERVACLAFYLSNYRDIPHFKTLDLSKLNTEAAQPKFSNAANSVNNAVKQGYLVPSTKGQRQMSAAGEQFVRALPDRSAAREAMSSVNRRRARRPKTAKPAGQVAKLTESA